MNTYSIAKKYKDRGWSVFPIRIFWNEKDQKHDKKPVISWKKYQDEIATDEELHTWFDQPFNDANGIGLATGKISSVIIVDHDSYKEKNCSHIFTSKIVVKTISGGEQYYYKYTESLRNAAFVDGPVDFRGDGGFAVVSGKCSHCNQSYTFINDAPTDSLLPLPDEIKQLLVKKEEKPEASEKKGEKDGFPYANKGERNTIAASVAGMLCNMIDEAVLEVAGLAALWEWNKTHCDEPLSEAEIRTVWKSIYEKHLRDKKNNEYAFGSGTKEQEEPVEKKKFLLKKATAWSDMQFNGETYSWIWENYLAQGHVTLLNSLYKAGKSTMLRCLLMSMSKEEEFIGSPTKKHNVYVLSEESDDEWARAREDFAAENITNVFINTRPVPKKPNQREWIQLIEEIGEECIEKDIHFVIIDTIATFFPVVNENDTAEWMPALVPLYALTNNPIKAGVLLIHHDNKQGGKDGRGIRGSGALPGFVTNFILFSKPENATSDTVRSFDTRGRFPDAPIGAIIADFDADSKKYHVIGSRYEYSKEGRIEVVIDILKTNPEGVTVNDIYRLWNRTIYGKPPSQQTLRTYMNQLVNEMRAFAVRELIINKRKTLVYGLNDNIDLSGNGTAKGVTPLPMSSFAVNLANETTAKDSVKTSFAVTDSSRLKTTAKDDMGVLGNNLQVKNYKTLTETFAEAEEMEYEE